MKSDGSQRMPIKGENTSEQISQQERPVSPVPSGVSMKSEGSMKMPITFKEEKTPEQIFQMNRSVSPVDSHVSMKSNHSMKMPIVFKDGENTPEDSQQERPVSPVPSGVSMKSEGSMKMPITFKEEKTPEQIFRDKPLCNMPRMNHWSMTKPAVFKEGEVMYPKHTEEIQEKSTVVEVSMALKSNLRERFQSVIEGIAKQDVSTLLKDIYTEVYIAEGGSGQISNEHEVRLIERGLKRVATGDIAIKCNDIFTPLTGQDKPIRIVLTKGVAGIGKTVSVQKFILDWAEGEANQDIHFIFPLPFRELNMMKDHKGSLMDLLHFFFAETKALNSSEIENYKAVFIFDGLDECRLPLDFQNNKTLCDVTESASVDVLLTDLIKGNLLPSALIWITSRPAAASQIPPEYVSRVTEIRGFNDPQKEEYFRKRISDQSMASRIISHIKSLRSLFIMCHIPVFCWMSATVLERMLGESEGGKIPRTLTQMYTHFLLIQTKIREKYPERRETEKGMILKLGRLAFEQLEKGNLIFYEEDLRECGIEVREASVYSGVFTQIFREECGLYQRKVYCFVHLSIQEHLAALYVFLSFCNNNTNVLEHQPNSEDGNQNKTVKLSDLHKSAVNKALQSKIGHLDLFLRFLLGLSLESNQILLKDFLSLTGSSSQDVKETIKHLEFIASKTPCPEKAVILFHCLHELNDHSLVEEIQNYLTSGVLTNNQLSQELWSALAFRLLTSEEKLDELNVRKYNKSEAVSLRLHPVIKASRKVLMQDCKLTETGCVMLTATLSSVSNVREFDLSHNDLQDSGVKILCTGLKHTHYSLDSVMMYLLGKTDMVQPSAPSAEKVSQKTKEQNKDKNKDSELPTAGLEDPECKLEALSLQNCGLTEKSCAYLASALRSNPSHLKSLDLSLNDLGDSGVKLLTDVLRDTPCKLEELKLNMCHLTEESCAALSSAVKTNLKRLTLNKNNLQDSGVKLLSAGLGSPLCKLEVLRLSNCRIRTEGCAGLAAALRSNPSHLKELDLGRNHLTDSGVKLIISALVEASFQLERLKLNTCGLTEKSCAVLASALSSNFRLRELDMSVNDLQDSGVTLLTAGLENPDCELEILSLYNCNITEEGCAALTSALRSNPSHLRELNLTGNKLGESGLELLSALLEDPQCNLDTVHMES